MLLHHVASTSSALAATRSRNAKRDALVALLTDLERGERAIAVTWLAGELTQGRIGVGYSALNDVRHTPAAAEASLTVAEVEVAFSEIATIAGTGSKQRRHDALVALLDRATAEEQGFLVTLLAGELRQGALLGVMVEAIAAAAEVPSELVRRALMLSGDVRAAARAAFGGGVAELAAFRVEVMRPLQPMLADTADSVEEALGRLGRAAFELKLDGARVQVHRDGARIRVFTRSLLDVTRAVPEVVEVVARLDARRVVLDGEAIAFDPQGRPHPFQTTMRRFGRKLDVARQRVELPLSVRFFDCLLLDDAELVDLPYEDRADRLDQLLPAEHRVVRRVLDAASDAGAFLEEALQAGHEGLMVKDLASTYQAGTRGAQWLKLKPAYTLDLVVLAAEWGSGRRRGWLSNLHLGARTDDGFVMLGKTFKGLTDQTLAWQTEALLGRETRREGHVVHVRPELVVEIAFNEMQTSPRYPAGLALRFARVVRYRPDKPPHEADTLDTVRRIHTRELLPGAR